MFIQRQLHVDSQVRIQGTNEIEEILGPKNTSMLADSLQLLPKHRPAAVSSKDHEVTDRPLGSMEIFVQAAGYE